MISDLCQWKKNQAMNGWTSNYSAEHLYTKDDRSGIELVKKTFALNGFNR